MRNCNFCGKEYEPLHKRSKYCSLSCGAKAQGDETRKRSIAKYYESPNLCKQCGKVIEHRDGSRIVETREKKFCDKSCAAIYNNRVHPKRGNLFSIDPESKIQKRIKLPPATCLYCGLEIKGYRKYCSYTCQQAHQGRLLRLSVLQAKEFPYGSLLRQDTAFHMEILLEINGGHRCSICERIEWQGKEIPLIIDHIDGNHENNKFENLRLICGNCDMQLPTYKNRNRGNGRHTRKERYKAGKSY